MPVRRIRHDEGERVAALWEAAADGALRPRGRSNLHAMLTLCATSTRTACFVAEVEDEVHGFVIAEVVEDRLLPERHGRLEELCGPRELLPELVRHAVGWLHEQGVDLVRAEAEEDDPDAVDLLVDLGWEREAVRFATYRAE